MPKNDYLERYRQSIAEATETAASAAAQRHLNSLEIPSRLDALEAALSVKYDRDSTIRDIAYQAAEGVAREIARQVAESAAREKSAKVAKEIAAQTAQSVAEQAAKESAARVAKEVAAQTVAASVDAPARRAAADEARGVADTTARTVAQKIAHDVAVETARTAIDAALRGRAVTMSAVYEAIEDCAAKRSISRIDVQEMIAATLATVKHSHPATFIARLRWLITGKLL